MVETPQGRTHDLGRGFTLREFYDAADPSDDLVGYTVTGPAHRESGCKKSGQCGGLCAVRPYSVPCGEGIIKTYPVWKATGEWPNITLTPSVACECGGQHAHVRDGRWA